MSKAYVCVITKNEGKDLAEWILYHIFLGFHKIIIYDNASADNTRDLIESCSQYGLVEYIYWPKPFSQLTAYTNCLKRFGHECEWIAFFDVDEFLVLPKHKYITQFLNSHTSSNAIAIHWRMFGSNDIKYIPSELVTKAFTKRAVDNFSANRHVKSIVRPKVVSKVLNPHFFLLKRLSFFSPKRHEYVDASGDEMRWLRPGKALDTGLNDTAIIYHYFTKSEEHYQKKLLRGNADKSTKRTDVFNYNNRNDISDSTITDIYGPELEKISSILASM